MTDKDSCPTCEARESLTNDLAELLALAELMTTAIGISGGQKASVNRLLELAERAHWTFAELPEGTASFNEH